MKRMLIVIFGCCFFGVALANVGAVNINKADVKALVSLKGIGPKKAEAIVASRRQHGFFRSINDLTRIKGIGKVFLQRLLKRNPGRLITKGDGK